MRGLAKAPTRLGRFLLFGFTIFLTQYIVGLVVLRPGGSSLLLVAASFPLMVAIAKYWLRAESKRAALAIGAAGAVPTLGAVILGIAYAQRKERWQQQAGDGPSPEKRGVLPGRDRLTVSLGIIGTSGLAVVALAFAVAFVGPLVWHVSPDRVSLPERWSGPSVGHPFGTDELGRDNLSRAMVWGRIVLAGGSSSAPPIPQGTR